MKLKLIPSNNNKIYRLIIFNKSFIIKFYINKKHTNLFYNEIYFYKRFKNLQNIYIPKKYISYSNFKIGIFKFYHLKKLINIKEKEIKFCCKFIYLINKDIHNYHVNAIECCLRPIDHIKAPLNKIKKLKKNIIKDSYLYKKVKAIQKEFVLHYWRLKRIKLNYNLHKPYSKKRFIVSPSDFGFHNIFQSNNDLFFLDFEHSGLDDIIKLICDFYFFPANDFDVSLKDYFKKSLINYFSYLDKSQLYYEIDLLLPFYKLKWDIIILNQLIHEQQY